VEGNCRKGDGVVVERRSNVNLRKEENEQLPTGEKILIWIAVFFFLFITLSPRLARGQSDNDARLIARICISEGPGDCAAISHVLSERTMLRPGSTLRQVACSYAPRSCGRRPYHARPWIPFANPDQGAPIGWAGVSSWEVTRVVLAHLTSVAWRAIRGIEPTPCPGAVHWGSRSCGACRRRMRAARLTRIQCSSSNIFYGYPAF